MYFQILSLLYSGTLLATALALAHPLHPRTAILQTRDLIGGLLGGGGLEPANTANDSQTAATGDASDFPVKTVALSVSSTVSTASSRTTTPFITQTTTTRRPSETSHAVSSSSTSIDIGYVADAPTTPPGEATEWKVIGIAIIAVTFIGSVILAITFFDSWWGFLRAMFLGNKHNGGDEKLVPDWEKRSWEYDLANEDGHRYPTMASLESIVKIPEKSAGPDSSPFVTR